jgi:hypothetical protein
MIDEFEIPIRSAKAWTVKKGMRFSARDFWSGRIGHCLPHSTHCGFTA